MKQTMKRLLTLGAMLILVFPSLATAAPMSEQEINKLKRTDLWYDNSPVEGCTVGGGGGSATVEPGENKRAAFLYFIQRGLTPFQSAGFVGNLEAESGVNPGINELKPLVPGSRGGYGIAQWTAGRRVAIENYARINNQQLDSLQFQLDYLWNEELEKGYRRSVLDPLRQTTTIRAASDIVLSKFETPQVIVDGIPGPIRALEEKRAALGQKIYELYGSEAGTAAPIASPAGSSCPTTPGGAIGFVGFPLRATKADMEQLNGFQMNATTKKMNNGHPYAAYDVFATPGTEILSILDGTFVGTYTDKCDGKLVSIYNQAQDVVVSYLHMGTVTVGAGQTITAGQSIGTVGSREAACGTNPHLHIDAVPGNRRPACTRESCPAANAAQFEQGDAKINLGGSLYDGYTKLQ